MCRLLQFMRANKKGCCVPDATGVERAETNMLGLTSGYLKRAEAYNPKVGAEFPWYALASRSFRPRHASGQK